MLSLLDILSNNKLNVKLVLHENNDTLITSKKEIVCNKWLLEI